MGCFLISFCLGNTAFPLGNGFVTDVHFVRKLLLCEAVLTAGGANEFADFLLIHDINLLRLSYRKWRQNPIYAPQSS